MRFGRYGRGDTSSRTSGRLRRRVRFQRRYRDRFVLHHPSTSVVRARNLLRRPHHRRTGLHRYSSFAPRRRIGIAGSTIGQGRYGTKTGRQTGFEFELPSGEGVAGTQTTRLGQIRGDAKGPTFEIGRVRSEISKGGDHGHGGGELHHHKRTGRMHARVVSAPRHRRSRHQSRQTFLPANRVRRNQKIPIRKRSGGRALGTVGRRPHIPTPPVQGRPRRRRHPLRGLEDPSRRRRRHRQRFLRLRTHDTETVLPQEERSAAGASVHEGTASQEAVREGRVVHERSGGRFRGGDRYARGVAAR
mmetsp:Transcript_11321/g.23738  ORF Transcript_11321/g.23738 Transcript_11321/m.23738 type:complete len:302 (-) Transcript_11321:148-1053(-)